MRAYIGFDTSCYTTSVAAVSEYGETLASARMLLPVSQGQRGLRQSEAVFAHIRQLPLVMEKLSEQAPDITVSGVGASSRPVDRDGSYMPVFVAGHSQARTLAAVNGLRCHEFSHQAGHLRAGWIGNGAPEKSYLAVHLSGGTTELLSVGEAITPIGGTLDLNAGQLVDRAGVKMGLGFPSGAALEALALKSESAPESIFPVSMEKGDMYCHLSGAEAKSMRLIDSGELPRERIAIELFDLIARTLARLLIAGWKATGADTALLVGGVASSTLLRRLLSERLERARANITPRFGRPEYSGDNAVGIALLTMENEQRRM